MSESTELMLPDLSDDKPMGDDLENDPDFGAMERASEHKAEVQYGSVITPAEPPNWKEVDALATSLAERTRDMRVLVHQAVARLNLSGPTAFAPIIGQLRYLIENRWEGVHPLLDPEDDNDPTLRANTLSRLRDERNVMIPLRDFPLARSPQTGAVSWRDIAISKGMLEPEAGREKYTEALIRDSFRRTDQDRLRELRDSIDLATREVTALSNAFDSAAGPVVDLAALTKLLGDIQREMKQYEPASIDAAPDAEAAAEAGGAAAAEADGGGVVQTGGGGRRAFSVRSITAISAREDALYLLELVSQYFRAYEPSSPAPLLIDRARRLATMEFIDILRDLAPDGINQAQVVTGPPQE